MWEKWIEAATNPIGLAAFALFLAFAYLPARRHLEPVTSVMLYGLAFFALIGGLFLAYQTTAQTEDFSSSPAGVTLDNSPIDVSGESNVTINGTGLLLPNPLTKNLRVPSTGGVSMKDSPVQASDQSDVLIQGMVTVEE